MWGGGDVLETKACPRNSCRSINNKFIAHLDATYREKIHTGTSKGLVLWEGACGDAGKGQSEECVANWADGRMWVGELKCFQPRGKGEMTYPGTVCSGRKLEGLWEQVATTSGRVRVGAEEVKAPAAPAAERKGSVVGNVLASGASTQGQPSRVQAWGTRFWIMNCNEIM
jgi:hypothetical protein